MLEVLELGPIEYVLVCGNCNDGDPVVAEPTPVHNAQDEADGSERGVLGTHHEASKRS